MMHNGNRQVHNCPVCSKTYWKLESLKEHVDFAHSEGDKEKFNCEFCEYFTYRKSHLRVHKCYQKNKKCPECSFESKKNDTLKVHIQREHAVNPTKFNCDNCEFTSFRKSSLTKHQKVTKCAKSRMK